MDAQLLTLLRKAAAAEGGTGFLVRFTGLSLLCVVVFGVLLTPLAKQKPIDNQTSAAAPDSDHDTMVESGSMLHLAIHGDGYFQIIGGNQIFYTRAGNFTTNEHGEVVLPCSKEALRLDPTVCIPENTVNITVTPRGVITARLQGTDTEKRLGIVQLVRFKNPCGLIPRGDNLLEVTEACGQPIVGDPGDAGMGTVHQRFLQKGINYTTPNLAQQNGQDIH